MDVLGSIQDDRGSMRNQSLFLFYFLCCFLVFLFVKRVYAMSRRRKETTALQARARRRRPLTRLTLWTIENIFAKSED